jgi:hypothetical protein
MVTLLAITVSEAGFVVAVRVPPQVFVKTALYWFPVCATPGLARVSGLDAPETLLHVEPEFVLTCHWIVGVGDPDAVAKNVASAPYVID